MANQGFTKQNTIVGRNFVYNMTGFPHPDDLEEILNNMLEAEDLESAIIRINTLKTSKGISLNSILTNLTERLIQLNLPANMLGQILKNMAEIEYRLSIGADEDLQVASLVAAFFEARFV